MDHTVLLANNTMRLGLACGAVSSFLESVIEVSKNADNNQGL